ncbi:FadR/GntR family transcriptional regulator [Amycolatopsis jiangsuensis]|uniref:DNA-binding FadR family transcriptional regulator n=1 Tax=Amycolatopsis jiangsuensis TaxID=1181879 RepID=A0A840IUV9_9PSEU|nr:FCD domain-containing protein [Amycolatopsis jiangsuensis]MBB4685563.1 DNA-binding FadR family transcriptional regulator [Amycolatopsis jiangsuensis]
MAADLGAPELTGIRRLSALDTVRARIALAIELGLLAPGERLPPNGEIARALGVGDITVRRALVSLCEDGILERRRGRNGGTLVAADAPAGRVGEVRAYREASDEVHQLIDHRLVLESGLVQLVALRRPNDAVVDELRALVRQMDSTTGWAEFHELDARFHAAVANVGAPPAAIRQYLSVLEELYRFYLPYSMPSLHQSNRDHEVLVQALAEHDPEAAALVTRAHVDDLHRTMFVGFPR